MKSSHLLFHNSKKQQLVTSFFLLPVKNAEFLQQAALEEYGPELHVALRSRRDELHYLRKLTELLFPYILPPKSTECRYKKYLKLFSLKYTHTVQYYNFRDNRMNSKVILLLSLSLCLHVQGQCQPFAYELFNWCWKYYNMLKTCF